VRVLISPNTKYTASQDIHTKRSKDIVSNLVRDYASVMTLENRKIGVPQYRAANLGVLAI
jgi:hypothetical protein